MHTRGAVIKQAPGTYEVVDLEVDDPRQGHHRAKTHDNNDEKSKEDPGAQLRDLEAVGEGGDHRG